ncbi:hypothetical protein C0J52_17736 [Blattella germanica]|nr:hypothetical protein C0J52_17736 [Blattella germanica]
MIEWKQSSTSIHTITSPVEESLEAEKSVESIVPSEFETIDGEVLITSESDNEVEKKSQEKQDEHSSNRVLKKIKTDVSVEKSSPLPPCTVVLEKISSTNKSTESKTSESNVAEEIPTVNKNAKEKSLKFKRKFPCEHCGQTFALSFLLKRHLNQLHKKKYYKCETCHRKFSTNNSLISHLFQHPDWKPCVCPKCKKTFQESNALKKHITNNMCLNNTANMKQSNNHESRNLIQPNKTQDEPKNIGFNTIHKLGGVLCKVCGNSYWTEEELTIHSALHVNQKELFLCELCIRNFEEKTTLECPHQVSENIH